MAEHGIRVLLAAIGVALPKLDLEGELEFYPPESNDLLS